MNDNPIYALSRREIRTYQKKILLYGKHTKQTFHQYKPTPNNQTFLQKWLFKLADKLGQDTQQHVVQGVEAVIAHTLQFYNQQHQGQQLSAAQLDELKLHILKEFLLSEFKGKTLDQRISQSVRRLKGNLQKDLQTLTTGYVTGSTGHVNHLINSITGTDYKEGGTAYRWNSRLVLSEMYRAYQYTGKVVLARLGVNAVRWVNSPRHVAKNGLLDAYAEKVYSPTELPEYPYPCNDSFFIPIY